MLNRLLSLSLLSVAIGSLPALAHPRPRVAKKVAVQKKWEKRLVKFCPKGKVLGYEVVQGACGTRPEWFFVPQKPKAGEYTAEHSSIHYPHHHHND